jgi:hypothetical protein
MVKDKWKVIRHDPYEMLLNDCVQKYQTNIHFLYDCSNNKVIQELKMFVNKIFYTVTLLIDW